MFFVALLLNAVAGWMRTQSGTSSLRAMVYMDEIFGFFPPTANPPSKGPLLTLLKQGRAAGVSVVLATQNPVDLDYKGLSNIGTWWLGRLQTERDKARLLDGLEGASDHGGFDRGEIDRLLSSLAAACSSCAMCTRTGSRCSSRDGRSRTCAGRSAATRSSASPRSRPGAAPGCTLPRRSAAEPVAPAAVSRRRCRRPAAARPIVPPEIPQFFSPDATGGAVPLTPVLYGAANVRFLDPKANVDVMKLVTWTTPIGDGAVAVDWDASAEVDIAPEMLERDAPDEATFAQVPAAALKSKNYDAWSKQFVTSITTKASLDVLRSPSTGEVSRPDESERDFRARLQQASRESRDRALETLRKKFAPRQAALDEKLRRAQQTVERESQQATGQKCRR